MFVELERGALQVKVQMFGANYSDVIFSSSGPSKKVVLWKSWKILEQTNKGHRAVH